LVEIRHRAGVVSCFSFLCRSRLIYFIISKFVKDFVIDKKGENKLGLSCVELRLNWASMLRLPVKRFGFKKLKRLLQSTFNLDLIIKGCVVFWSSSLEVVFHFSKNNKTNTYKCYKAGLADFQLSKAIFYLGLLPWTLSSLEVVFLKGRLPSFQQKMRLSCKLFLAINDYTI
jgi:hypothetical protein